MSKIKLILIVAIALVIGSCGIKALNTKPINANIVSNSNNPFVVDLKSQFDQNQAQSFSISVSDEVRKKHAVAFAKDGRINRYQLILQVKVKVFNRQKTLLLNEVLTTDKYVSRIIETTADNLQIEAIYTELRGLLVRQLLHKLNAAN